MLPSGNDAAVVLAENFGRYLVLDDNRANFLQFKNACEIDPFCSTDSKVYIKRFV